MKFPLQNGTPRPSYKSYKWKNTYHFVFTNRGSTLTFFMFFFHITDSFFRPWTYGSGRVSDLGQFYFSIVDTEMIETLSILEAPDVVLQELVLLHTVCPAPVCHHRLRMIAQKCSYKMVHGFSPKKMISLQNGHWN